MATTLVFITWLILFKVLNCEAKLTTLIAVIINNVIPIKVKTMNKYHVLLTTFFIVTFAQNSLTPKAHAANTVSGGESGYDKTIDAIEPSDQKLSISLAGETLADISRYILASNQGAGGGRISPDGESVAFQWSITGKSQLWLVMKQGGMPRQLTFGNGISFFRWSPDSQSLIYGADNDGNEQEAYYRISLDGNKESLLLPSVTGGFRRFGDFVDSNNIAFSSTERNGLDFDIYTANIENQKSTLLYKGKFGFFVSSVSPDGRYIVINETVGEDSDNLYLFDTKAQKMSVVSQPERRANHSDGGIAWTPDSKGFYLATNLERDFAALMHYSIGGDFSLIHSADGDVGGVMLCGEKANLLVWSENVGGYSELNVKDVNTQKAIKTPSLAEGVYNTHCNKGNDNLTVSVNGWKTPGDIYSWNMTSGELHHTFRSNLAGLNERSLVKPQSINITARDGVVLQGLLYLPEVEQGSRSKPPVLFRVHGGPTAQSRPNFRATTQYLVAKGIAVFLPNVRGSTGFGHNYVTLDDRENRLDSIRDLVDMLKHLESDGRVDTKRAAVAGGSYGGYAVNAVLANFPGHFIAGVSLFGVADWVTALKIASPGLKASDRIEYGDINEQKWLDFYTQESPLRQADQIDVPVLYSHGVADPRIDILETETMVKTLRKNGIEAPFIRIPDEGHGWRKLKNQLFYARKEAAFLEEKLGLSDSSEKK